VLATYPSSGIIYHHQGDTTGNDDEIYVSIDITSIFSFSWASCSTTKIKKCYLTTMAGTKIPLNTAPSNVWKMSLTTGSSGSFTSTVTCES